MNNKIKIAFFCPNLGGGGAEMHLARLIKYLDKSQFEVYLFLSRKGGQYEEMIPSEVEMEHLNVEKLKGGIQGLMTTVNRLSSKLKKLNPDIFCSIMDHANIMAYLAHKRSGVQSKLVFCVQTPILQGLKFNWSIFNKCISLLIPYVYPKADKVIALSEGVKMDLISMSKRLRENTEVINNIGIELNHEAEFIEGTLGATDKPKKVAMVCGRLIKLKGFDDVIKAISIVRKSLDIELWLVGEGPEKESLIRLAQELKIQDHVKLLGFQKAPQEFMKKADVFVLSSHYEGFGNVIIEAMSMGTPVVSTDCPYGPSEIITSNKDGVLVPVGDYDKMAESIINILTNDKFKRDLVNSGFQRTKYFEGNNIAKQYESSFRNVL